MEKLYYPIGEVAEILGEAPSLVRFWTTTFEKFLKPRRNVKGNRIYTVEEIDTLKQIHFLVKEQGLTLEGAARQPEAAGDLRTTMIIIAALLEGAAMLGLVICLLTMVMK